MSSRITPNEWFSKILVQITEQTYVITELKPLILKNSQSVWKLGSVKLPSRIGCFWKDDLKKEISNAEGLHVCVDLDTNFYPQIENCNESTGPYAASSSKISLLECFFTS